MIRHLLRRSNVVLAETGRARHEKKRRYREQPACESLQWESEHEVKVTRSIAVGMEQRESEDNGKKGGWREVGAGSCQAYRPHRELQVLF